MTYATLLATLDRWFARGSAAAGSGIVPCTSGCSACCHGPFDISPADAELLRTAVDALPEADRLGVEARARAQVARYADGLADWGAPWDVEAIAEETFDALLHELQELPCPALSPTGGCLVYEARPATCRMTGLAMRTAGGDLLENVCPIRQDFPDYDALGPTPFDLHRFEAEAEAFDQLAMEGGWVTTTVAGAVLR